MIDLVDKECTYEDLIEATGRSAARLRVLAREIGLKHKIHMHQRVFSAEDANDIITYYNALDLRKAAYHAKEPPPAPKKGLMTAADIAKRAGISRRQIAYRIAALAMPPAEVTRGSGRTPHLFYSEDQALRLTERWKPVHGTLSQMPKEPPVREIVTPAWVTIRWFAVHLKADRAAVYHAVRALALPIKLLPGGTADKQLVEHYESKYLRLIKKYIDEGNAAKTVFIRRQATEDD